MGVEYNDLGEECESIKEIHRRGNSDVFKNKVFSLSSGVHGKEGESEKRELGTGATMEEKLWSVN
jgi:hypothetical protein